MTRVRKRSPLPPLGNLHRITRPALAFSVVNTLQQQKYTKGTIKKAEKQATNEKGRKTQAIKQKNRLNILVKKRRYAPCACRCRRRRVRSFRSSNFYIRYIFTPPLSGCIARRETFIT